MSGKIIHFERVDSTNARARHLALAGNPHGTGVLADAQSTGRGTKGRTWFSPPKFGLYASYVLRPGAGESVDGRVLAGLPFAAGLAAAETVAEVTGALCRLKWPNDLVWGHRKVGGILVETVFTGPRFEFAVAGIGLNLLHQEADFPEDLRDRAASILMASGRRTDAYALAGPLGEALERWYNILINRGKIEVIKAFEGWLAFSPGRCLKVQLGERIMKGTFRGLDPEGRLLLRTDDRIIGMSSDAVTGLDWEE